MEIKEFYSLIDGDYEGTLGRMMKDERILKYITKFIDSEDYDCMVKGIEDGDMEAAFRYSHNLKGVALNLGFSKLADSASRLCEEYRHGAPDHDTSDLQKEVADDYSFTIEKIKELIS